MDAAGFGNAETWVCHLGLVWAFRVQGSGAILGNVDLVSFREPGIGRILASHLVPLQAACISDETVSLTRFHSNCFCGSTLLVSLFIA